jgi:hypothetical protein
VRTLKGPKAEELIFDDFLEEKKGKKKRSVEKIKICEERRRKIQ